jgi:hypothetical protein
MGGVLSAVRRRLRAQGRVLAHHHARPGAPRLRAGQVATPRLLRHADAHAPRAHALAMPHAQHLAIPRAQARRPSLGRRHAPRPPSHIRPLRPDTAHRPSTARRRIVCVARCRTRPSPLLLELSALAHIHRCLVNVPASWRDQLSLLLAFIAPGAAVRHPRRRRPSPEVFPAKPTTQISQG